MLTIPSVFLNLVLSEAAKRRVEVFRLVQTGSIYEQTMRANEEYASGFDLGQLAMPPAKRLAVVACMDARLTIERMLGLRTGDAHIIRNAGGLITEDTLRSLIISHKLLGTQTFFVIEHTDCGMLTFRDEELRQRLKEETGEDPGMEFLAFSDLRANLLAQMEKLRRSRFFSGSIEVHGFIFDVKSGKLIEAT